MIRRIDVIDPDVRRRARVSRDLRTFGVHTEIYEDVEEFMSCALGSGLIFVSDDHDLPFAASMERIRAAANGIAPIVGYAQEPLPERIVAGMHAGAFDYLALPFKPQVLDKTLRRLANGGGELVQQQLLRARAKAKVKHLTRREADVLKHLVRGRSNKEIAGALGLSPRTVEIHRANMFSRLGAHSAPDAVRIGVYAGLDECSEVLELLTIA